jgi:hypothetical protein
VKLVVSKDSQSAVLKDLPKADRMVDMRVDLMVGLLASSLVVLKDTKKAAL